MTGPVQPLVWTKRGCTCLHASSDPIIPFQHACADPDIGSPADWGWMKTEDNYVEGVLDQNIAHRVKLPGSDQMFVQERLHQKVQMPSF